MLSLSFLQYTFFSMKYLVILSIVYIAITIIHYLVLSCTIRKSHNFFPSLMCFHFIVLYLCLVQSDSHMCRNLQGPLCNITGQWVTIVIAAAQSSQGSVSVLAVDALWVIECVCFRLDQREWTMGTDIPGGWLHDWWMLRFKPLCLCWLCILHILFFCVYSLKVYSK